MKGYTLMELSHKKYVKEGGTMTLEEYTEVCEIEYVPTGFTGKELAEKLTDSEWNTINVFND